MNKAINSSSPVARAFSDLMKSAPAHSPSPMKSNMAPDIVGTLGVVGRGSGMEQVKTQEGWYHLFMPRFAMGLGMSAYHRVSFPT